MAALLSGCGGAAASASPASQPPPEAPTVTGEFVLVDPGGIRLDQTAEGAESCKGTGGYDDIAPGLGVVVRNEDGKTIGTGTLENPEPPADNAVGYVGTEGLCRFVFQVPLRETATFYAIEVGTRGELTYSHTDLEATDWAVEASLGE
jgi:hypothetical protein